MREELGDQRTAETTREPDTSPDAFYPLTMPLTVGPGAISVAIALGTQRPKEATDFAHLAMLAGVAIAERVDSPRGLSTTHIGRSG